MSRSERRKTMPEPAGAGMRRIVTPAPECRPIPRKSSVELMVCSNWRLVSNGWLGEKRHGQSITAV